MFYKIFQEACKKDNPVVRITALKHSPYSPVTKYLQLGFDIIDGDINDVERMIIREEGIDRSLRDLAEKIKLVPLKNQEEVDLEKELDIVI